MRAELRYINRLAHIARRNDIGRTRVENERGRSRGGATSIVGMT
jgi:hypothetical protein